MRPVLCIWEDACSESETWVWQEGAKSVPPKIIHQIGFVVSHTAEAIELTQAIEEPGMGLMAARDRIPAGMVIAIIELDPGNML